MLITKEQFEENAVETCEDFSFEKVKFNFSKLGVTFKADVNFDTLFDAYLSHIPSRLKRMLISTGAYTCDGLSAQVATRHHVSFWLDEYETSLNIYVKQVERQLESNYLKACNQIYSQLKISDLWTAL
jgi:hypothetical protein